MSVRVLRENAARVEPYQWGGTATPSASRTDAALPGPTPAGKPDDFSTRLRAAESELSRQRAEAEIQAQRAHQQGLDEGRRCCQEEARTELEAYRTQLAKSLERTESAYRETVCRAEQDLLQLSVSIAEKILHRQLQVDPDALRGVVKAALERLGGKAIQAVRLHPEDASAIERHFAESSAGSSLHIEADAALPRGSLILETAYGTLDGSFATQLREIESGLTDRLRRSSQ